MVQMWLHWLRTRQEGQGMTEYALILGLIAVVVIAALTALGGSVKDVFNTIQQEIYGALNS